MHVTWIYLENHHRISPFWSYVTFMQLWNKFIQLSYIFLSVVFWMYPRQKYFLFHFLLFLGKVYLNTFFFLLSCIISETFPRELWKFLWLDCRLLADENISGLTTEFITFATRYLLIYFIFFLPLGDRV